MEAERSATFEKLRPVCVALTQNQCRTNAEHLLKQLKLVKVPILQDLQQYVIFPVRLIFKQQQVSGQIQEDLLQTLCECLLLVLSHTTVSIWELFQDVFTSITCLLGPPDGSHSTGIASEELKLALVKVLGKLLKAADRRILEMLYSPASLPPLGHAISVILPLVEREKSREIQLAAMDCLLQLCQAVNKHDRKHQVNCGNIVASFLPGIAMTLCRVVTGDTKQGHAVISRAMEVFSKVVCLVLGDSYVQDAPTASPDSKLSDKLRSLVVHRSEDWVKVTGSKMAVLIRQIATVRTRSNWRVRLALANWAENLLQYCSKSLKDSTPVLLEALVGLIGDEYQNVAKQAKNSLQMYKAKQAEAGNESRDLLEIVEENLLELVTSLPRQIRSTDEEQKLGTVSLLVGYLNLLGPQVTNLLHSQPHLHRLGLALVQCLEMDSHGVHIVEQRSALPGYEFDAIVNTNTRQNRSFRHFRDERTETSLYKACHLLGTFGDLHILADHFLDLSSTSRIYQTSSTLVLNEVLRGLNSKSSTETHRPVTGSSPGDVLDVVRTLLEEYLSPDILTLPTCLPGNLGLSVMSPVTPSPIRDTLAISSQIQNTLAISSQNQNALTVSSLNQNILHLSVCLEGVGVCADVLGADFQPMLRDVLYPLLEKTGDDSALVSDAAYRSLVHICHACQYRSIDELLRQNADYLMNSISLRLRHLAANPRAPRVLQVILHYSQRDILPLLDDTVQEILGCLDDHHQEEAAMFMRVLHSLMTAVNRWFPLDSQVASTCTAAGTDKNNQSELVTADTCPTSTPEKSSSSDVRDFFLEYHRQKRIANGDVEEGECADVSPEGATEDCSSITDTDRPEELPKHVTIVKEILTRSKHLLSSSSPRLRLLVLDVVAESATALNTRRNELLPLLHDLWKPLVARFADEEKLVTVRAIKTLTILCNCSGDFLRKRIFKDVTPKLGVFLSTQANISQGSAQAYLHTVNCKLQLACLTSLAAIAQKVEAGTMEVDSLAKSYLLYLSCRQPKPLQEAAVSGLQQLISIEPDALWLQLCDLFLPFDLSPPGSQFKPVKFACAPEKPNEYTDNVLKLLPFTDPAR